MKNCPTCGSMMPDQPETCARCRSAASAAAEAPPSAPAPAAVVDAGKPRRAPRLAVLLAVAAALGAGVYALREVANSTWFMGRSLGDQSKGRLGSIRSALSIYYGDMEGAYPADLAALTVNGKYLEVIPPSQVPGAHQPSSAVALGKTPDDAGGWLYNNDSADMNAGTVRINCTHTDSNGAAWSAF